MKRLSLLLLAFSILILSSCGGGDNPVVVMETSEGTIKIELYQSQAPISVANFLKYVDEKHYDDTIFHRVKPGFMIQGGGFNKDHEEKKTHAPIKNESNNGLANERGTLAMARTGEPDSATAQFFINVVDNNFLNRKSSAREEIGYAVFGKVIEGMDVVDAIREVETDTKELKSRLPNGKIIPMPANDVPTELVVIESIRRLQK